MRCVKDMHQIFGNDCARLENMKDVDRVLDICRGVIRKKSIRIQEFFVDFDRLR